MNKINAWMRSHPWQIVGFTFWFTSLAAAAAFRDDWKWSCAGLCLAGIIVWWACLYFHSRTPHVIISLLLGVLPSTKAQQPFPPSDPQPALPYAVGAVVICGGLTCAYFMYKFCQAHFPEKKTNEQFYAYAGEEYGASWSYSALGSCPPPPDDFMPASGPVNPTTFMLNVSIMEDGVTTSMNTLSGAGTTTDFAGFQRNMAAHGLVINERPGSQSFEWNRTPCDPSQVPMSFDPWTQTITMDGDNQRLVVVERSMDLVTWNPFLKTVVGTGAQFQVVDTTLEGHMFYRVTTQ